MADLLDNCRFLAGSMGTADFADGAADPTFRNLEDAGAEDGKTYPYKAQNATGTEWEIGRGMALNTSGGWILERTSIQDSSNGGSLVNFGTAPKVIITAGREEFGAETITYDNAESGLDATDVQAAIDETAQLVSEIQDKGVTFTPMQWGAVGDGSTDDASALNAAIAAMPDGAELNGLGRTYRIDDTVDLKANITLSNIVLDMSNAANDATGLMAAGSTGSPVSISSGATAGSKSLTVADGSGFAAGDYVYVTSSDMWDDWDDMVPMGEVHKISGVVSNTLALYDAILHGMPTSPVVRKINTIDTLTLRRVRVIGSGAGASGAQSGIHLISCQGLVVEDCEVTYCDYIGLRLDRCINFSVRGGYYGHAHQTGLSYGIGVHNACHSGSIGGVTMIDCRHGLTFGDNDGVSRYITVNDNSCVAMREAGLDAHTAAEYCTVSDNTIECDPAYAGAGGILWRGGSVVISGNVIRTPGAYGILFNVNVNNTAVEIDIKINDNIVSEFTHTGIRVEKRDAGDVRSVGVSGNALTGGTGAQNGVVVTTDNSEGTVISGVIITGNNVHDVANTGIFVISNSATSVVSGVVVSGNLIASTCIRGIRFVAVTDGNIKDISVLGNILPSPYTITTGIVGVNEENLSVVANVLTGANTLFDDTASNRVAANNLV